MQTPIDQAETDHELACVWQILETVFDPEIPVVSIRELGILRDVRRSLDACGTIEVVITPTYSGCPAMGTIADDVSAALRAAKLSGRIVTQLAPAWTTDWMSPAAKDKLRAYGIAPPQCSATKEGQAAIINIAAKHHRYWTNDQNEAQNGIICPQCGANDTTEVSHFASTACKALYKCLTCMEPFDYFKPH